MLKERRLLSCQRVAAASLIIQSTFVSMAEFSKAKIIALYMPLDNEVATFNVVSHALAMKKTVLAPVVCGEGLVFRQIRNISDVRPGAFGILEPDACNSDYELRSIDIIVVPGVAFDIHGRRIGFGKGFYDKILYSLEGQGRLIGFCYDFQLVDEIVGEHHDVKMDIIITEKRVINSLF